MTTENNQVFSDTNGISNINTCVTEGDTANGVQQKIISGIVPGSRDDQDYTPNYKEVERLQELVRDIRNTFNLDDGCCCGEDGSLDIPTLCGACRILGRELDKIYNEIEQLHCVWCETQVLPVNEKRTESELIWKGLFENAGKRTRKG